MHTPHVKGQPPVGFCQLLPRGNLRSRERPASSPCWGRCGLPAADRGLLLLLLLWLLLSSPFSTYLRWNMIWGLPADHLGAGALPMHRLQSPMRVPVFSVGPCLWSANYSLGPQWLYTNPNLLVPGIDILPMLRQGSACLPPIRPSSTWQPCV